MRKHIFFALCAAAVAFAGCNKDNFVAPELELAVSELSIPAEGGVSSVSYVVANPAEDGLLDVVAAQSWVSAISNDVAGKNVTFNVEPVCALESRSQVLTFTYTYGDNQVVKKEVLLVQSAGTVTYEYEMTNIASTWYGTDFSAGKEHNYYTWVSDKPFSDKGETLVGGTYYLLDLFASAPEDEENLRIPAGKYTLGSPGSTAVWTFSPEHSKAVRYGDDVTEFEASFIGGEVTVSYEAAGDVVLEALLTDTEGKIHHVSYKGAGNCVDDRSLPKGFRKNVSFSAKSLAAKYLSDDGQNMKVSLRFSDAAAVDKDETMVLNVEAFMPLDRDGKIAAGTYKVSSGGTSMSMTPGSDLFGWFYNGTYAQKKDPSASTVTSIVAAGTMAVTENNGIYSFECKLKGADDYAIECSWNGEISVAGVPGFVSTLIGDYTLDLNGAEGSALTYGDYYGTGGNNYTIRLLPGTSPDGVQIDVTCDPAVGGIVSGTYKAASGYPGVGEYCQGGISGGYILGTMYLGGYSGGAVTQCAPAISGDLNITNNGDDTYKISFEFKDDKGYTWDGEWSGPITIDDQSGASVSSYEVKPLRGMKVRPAYSLVIEQDSGRPSAYSVIGKREIR